MHTSRQKGSLIIDEHGPCRNNLTGYSGEDFEFDQDGLALASIELYSALEPWN